MNQNFNIFNHFSLKNQFVWKFQSHNIKNSWRHYKTQSIRTHKTAPAPTLDINPHKKIGSKKSPVFPEDLGFLRRKRNEAFGKRPFFRDFPVPAAKVDGKTRFPIRKPYRLSGGRTGPAIDRGWVVGGVARIGVGRRSSERTSAFGEQRKRYKLAGRQRHCGVLVWRMVEGGVATPHHYQPLVSSDVCRWMWVCRCRILGG